MSGPHDALGLYVHWPYCARICPYCDFNVYRMRDPDQALVEAILTDMRHWRELTGARPLVSIHFGGGTPSLLPPVDLAHLIEGAADLWGLHARCEIGLEANPDDAVRFDGFADAGINRLSLGVQSFDDDALVMLGRDHDGRQARVALEQAVNSFERVSLDLIYARNGQSLAAWREDLNLAAGSGAGHISPYQLTIETGTSFAKRTDRGERLAADADATARFYEANWEMCEKAGFAGYEISNHARSVADQSRHNRIYWDGGDWIGVGPGAHGRLGRACLQGRIATTAVRRPADYIQSVRGTGHGMEESDVLSAAEEAAERILMGMRLTDGLNRSELRNATGLDVDPGGLQRMQEDGFVRLEGDGVALTGAGRLLADRVSGELVPDIGD